MVTLTKFVLVVALFSLHAVQILACINEPPNDIRVGKPIYTLKLEPRKYIEELLSGQAPRDHWISELEERKRAALRTPTESYDNSIAVALLHLGKTEEALEILKKLEHRDPGSYYVAANLGTAYELHGDNENAYKWIAEGMKRNPRSHFGTEWLHLKILEAKQAIKKDPKWIENNSVLGIDWRSVNGDLTKVIVTGFGDTLYTADAIENAIEYQLHERTEFVKPTDPTVASLLHDLSQLLRNSRSEEHANLVLEAAYNYGHPRPAVAPATIAVPVQETRPTETKSSFLMVSSGIVLSIVLMVVILLFIRSRSRA